MGQCGTMTAGRRRKTRKMRAGAAYGFGEAITPGALTVNTVDTSVPMRPDGTTVADPFRTSPDTNAKVTGGRRRTRKGKKGGKKSRKSRASRVSRSRKMRGGAGVYNAASVGTSFTGAVSGMPGSQTYGGYTGYAARVPVGGPVQGSDGVYRV